jgi:nucleotide-binding universal stress UspA family protein
MYQKILVGFDGSPGSIAALHTAAQLAKQEEGAVIALWVHAPLPRFAGGAGELKAEREAAIQFLAKLRRRATQIEREHDVPVALEQQAGNPSKLLVRTAQLRKCDLIVMGHSGHSRLWGHLLGHTADRVSEYAHCDVLITRRG